jgi:hypothetical protein
VSHLERQLGQQQANLAHLDARSIMHLRDCRKFGGQAAIAACGCVSLAGWNLCPEPEPSVPL